jgi:CHAT domain-containing protein
LRPLRDRLNWLTRRLQRLEQEASNSKPLMDELQRTEGELLERSRRGRMAALVASREPVPPSALLDVAALQAALRPGDALVEYGVLDDQLFACVVTHKHVSLVRRMANWSDVVEEIEATRFQIETLRHGAGRVAQHLPALTQRMQSRLARLHALLWAPLEAGVAGCRRVLLVPHAQLGALPFAALAAPGGAPLGQRFEVAVAPSARAALRGLAQQPVPARRALALAETSRLPHTGREAEFVVSLFEQGQAFVAEAATTQCLREHAAAADVIHLACHAQFRSDNPRFSALHLHDAPLSADLAETLALKPCTVVLSACETGLAEQGAGDEMVGLVRAFLVAGAARVVASLWTVDDQLTVQFMAQFYGALVRGAAPAAALRIAQAAAMQQHPHPFGWAAFTLYGGW